MSPANNTDAVNRTHPDYDATSQARRIWNDTIRGTLAIRNRQYLPQFPAELDTSHEYRIKTSTLFNMTEKTRNVMAGLVFQNPITLRPDVPGEIVTLWENFDNQGNHGDVFWRSVFEAAFSGWGAVLIDSPAMQVFSLEEELSLQIRPYAIAYHADHVINWRHRVNSVSKAKELELIVFKEITNELKAGARFETEVKTRYRMFELIGSAVSWELWEEQRKERTNEIEIVLIQSGLLERATRIPVSIVGNLGDAPPLIDIALKNIEHFQTYSDYKNLIHKSCRPMPIGKGLILSPDGERTIVISPDRLTETSENGDFSWAEVEGKSLEVVRQSLLDNREEIALMGLSLLADKTAKVDITATEALLNNIGETAELRVMARSTQDAIELSFENLAENLGLGRENGGSIIMGTAWDAAKMKEDQETLDQQSMAIEVPSNQNQPEMEN